MAIEKVENFMSKTYMVICGLNWSLRGQFKVKMCFFWFSSGALNVVMTSSKT